MDTLHTRLKERALSALHNPFEVNDEALERACEEALELTENKPLPLTHLVDLALFRLKLFLKIEPSETDIDLARFALKKAASMRMQEGEIGGAIVSGQRESLWDF